MQVVVHMVTLILSLPLSLSLYLFTGGMTIQPYFDEEQLEHILHTDEEDEDEEDVGGISPEMELDVADDDSSDEIVMLHNHKNRRKQ